jgi:hypothetical protein
MTYSGIEPETFRLVAYYKERTGFDSILCRLILRVMCSNLCLEIDYSDVLV